MIFGSFAVVLVIPAPAGIQFYRSQQSLDCLGVGMAVRDDANAHAFR